MRADPQDSDGALVLAAGYGRRFGGDKRRYRLADGQTLLTATLRRYAEVFARVAVVIRDEDDELAAEIDQACPAVRVLRASDAHLGMGHSLAAGVRQIREHWSSICIALGDMPYVRADTLQLLRDFFRAGAGDQIVQPTHRGTPGHPVFFARNYYDELAALRGDEGARSVLSRHTGRVRRVAVEDPGVLTDMDRPL